MAWVGLSIHVYKWGGTVYDFQLIPLKLLHRSQKNETVVYLQKKLKSKAAKSLATASIRIERYLDSLSIAMTYRRNLGLEAIQNTKRPFGNHCSNLDALDLYHRLKGNSKNFSLQVILVLMKPFDPPKQILPLSKNFSRG